MPILDVSEDTASDRYLSNLVYIVVEQPPSWKLESITALDEQPFVRLTSIQVSGQCTATASSRECGLPRTFSPRLCPELD